MSERVKIDLPFVKAYSDRYGKRRYYFRKKGKPSVRLPDDPASEAFSLAYHKARDSTARVVPSKTAAAGTFEALVLEYTNSAKFTQLAESTRREMRYVMNTLVRTNGDIAVKSLQSRDIELWQDELKDRPGAANKMVRVLKTLLKFAKKRGYRADNPASGIELLKGGRWRAWDDAELARFESRWDIGTLERTAYALALYTGQRRGDCVNRRKVDVAGRDLHYIQGKTGTRMVTHMHSELVEALAGFMGTHDGETILAFPDGKPLGPVYLGHRMAEAIEAAGLPQDCVFHGLRKTTARIIAELELNSKPVTGHLTDAMRNEYERDASQKKLAKAAILKWERRKRPAKERIRKVSN